MLSNPECSKFVADLLRQAAAYTPQDTPQGDSLMDLFEKISRQGNYVLKNDLRIEGRVIGGTVSGSIYNKDATVLLRARGYFTTTPGALANSQRWYVITAFHETFHLGGRYGAGYTDEALGRAAFAITGDKSDLPSESLTGIDRVLAWSSYFDRQLLNKCAPDFNSWSK